MRDWTIPTLVVWGLLAALGADPAPAAADEDVPCVRIGRALAHGSLAQRVETARIWQHDPAALVEQCPTELKQGFQADARRYVQQTPRELWRDENGLLLQLLMTLDVSVAGDWAPRLDTSVLDAQQIAGLARYWITAAEPATEEAFALVRQIDDEAIRGDVLHTLLPRILDLEAASVTAAAQVTVELENVDAGRLMDDQLTAMLWPLSTRPRPFQAEAALLSGDLREAFRRYAEAAETEERYLFHTAILAEQLFATGDLEPVHLIPLDISYSLCKRTYRVETGLGAIYRLRQSADDGEWAAELAVWHDQRCNDTRDQVDRAKALRRFLQERHPGTRAAARQQLIEAQALSDRADELTDVGRSNRANELRREALELLENPGFFRFPGGAGTARALAHHLLSELPPELDVAVDSEEDSEEAPDAD